MKRCRKIALHILILNMLFSGAVWAANTEPPTKVDIHTFYSDDSDTIIRKQIDMEATTRLNDKLAVRGGVSAFTMDADQESGLRAGDVNAGELVRYYQPWLGLRVETAEDVSVWSRLGYEKTNVDSKNLFAELGLSGQPYNGLHMSLTANRSLYAVSPRAISREVIQKVGALDTTWQTTPQLKLSSRIRATDFSDGNQSFYASLSPAWQIGTQQPLRYDIGLEARYFGYDKDLQNGYYDPQSAQRYMLTNNFALQDTGFGNWHTAIAIGQRKDDRIGEFDWAGDLSSSANFTLHPGIDLGVHGAGVYEAAGNLDPYWYYEVGLRLTAQF